MNGCVLAIDPGNELSAVVLVQVETYIPIMFAKLPNEELMEMLVGLCDKANYCVIEMIGHYGTGMAVGKMAFNTWVWIGRIAERILGQGLHPIYILRQTIKAHLCGNANAKDENVIRALKVRFRDKGTKKCPEFFCGTSADVWLVFALAVTYIDQQKEAGPDPGAAVQPDVGPSK